MTDFSWHCSLDDTLTLTAASPGLKAKPGMRVNTLTFSGHRSLRMLSTEERRRKIHMMRNVVEGGYTSLARLRESSFSSRDLTQCNVIHFIKRRHDSRAERRELMRGAIVYGEEEAATFGILALRRAISNLETIRLCGASLNYLALGRYSLLSSPILNLFQSCGFQKI